MARNKPKVWQSTAHDPWRFEPTDAEWSRLEVEYGVDLSPDARASLSEITDRFAAFEAPERSAPSISDAQKALEEIEGGIAQASNMLEALSKENPDLGEFIELKLNAILFDRQITPSDERVRRRDYRSELRELLDTARSFGRLINPERRPSGTSEERLAVRSGFRRGDAWRGWAINVAAWAADFCLPTGIRNDDLAADLKSASPFVRFFWLLQANIPDEARKHNHSVAALAKALLEVRRRHRLMMPCRDG